MGKFIDYNKLRRHSLTSRGFDLFVESEPKTSTHPDENGRHELQPSNPLLCFFIFFYYHNLDSELLYHLINGNSTSG